MEDAIIYQIEPDNNPRWVFQVNYIVRKKVLCERCILAYLGSACSPLNAFLFKRERGKGIRRREKGRGEQSRGKEGRGGEGRGLRRRNRVG